MEKVKKVQPVLVTVTLPPAVAAVPKVLGKVYYHTLSDEQMKRQRFNKTQRLFPMGIIKAVHPQKRLLTVEVPGNRVAWVKRVILGEVPKAELPEDKA